MKRFVLLTVTVLLSLTAFSQTGTNNEIKCFPLPVAKQIAKDLLRGDSAFAQLKLSENLLFETEQKILMKDSIINVMSTKEKNYIKIIDIKEVLSINIDNDKFEIIQNYLGLEFIMLKYNRYVNITKLCASTNKKYKDYGDNQRRKNHF